MKKTALLLAVALLISMASVALADVGVVTILYDRVYIREQADAKSEVVKRANAGETYPCLEVLDGWYKLSVDGRVGYVAAKTVSFEEKIGGTTVSGRPFVGLWGAPDASATVRPEAVRPTAAPTVAPTATPSLAQISDLRVTAAEPMRVSASWRNINPAPIFYELYQADTLWATARLNSGTSVLSVSELVPNCQYLLMLYDANSSKLLDSVYFRTPEAARYTKASLSMMRMCNADNGSNYFSSYNTLRNVTVSQITDPSKFLYVLFKGEKQVGGQLVINQRKLVVYRDGDVALYNTYDYDTIPADWYGFDWYFEIDREKVSKPGSYTVTLYFDDLRLGTTTFSVQ